MNILGIWDDKFSLRYVPITLVQVVFCAGTAFVLSAVQATSGPRLGRVTLSTAVTGDGYLGQFGTGTLILTGANSYTGGTVILDGTLQVGNGGLCCWQFGH